MGAAIDALPRGVKNVQRNPMLVVITVAIGIASLPVLLVAALLGIIPLVGPIVSRVVVAGAVKPLLIGGIVGVAGAGFAGSVGFGDYLDTVKEDFVTLAGTYLLYEIGVFVFGLLLVVVMLFTGLMGSFAGAAAGESSLASAGVGLGIVAVYVVGLVLILAYAVVFQFLDVAVVLGDNGVTDAFRESWRLVREAPLSVAGYTVLRGLLGAAILLPGYVIVIAGLQTSDAVMWAGLAVTLLLYPVAFAVVMSYHAAYYGVRLRSA